MRSLFARIFISFWVTMLVVVAVLVVTSPLWTRSRPGVERWQRGAEQVLAERVGDVARSLELSEPAPRSVHRPRRGGGPPLRITLLDAEGQPVDGPPPERDDRELALRSLAAGQELTERVGAEHRLARPVRTADGRELVVVGTLRRPPQAVDLLDPRVLLPRLALLTAVVGLFCLLLARHLSAPFAELRAATQRLAEGELSARVGPAVSRRRDEIGDLGRDFDTMAERLEQLVSSQRTLLRDVSHELRSPLARLEVALELARQRGGDAVAEPLARIGRESARVNELIGQLLSLARLEAGAAVEAMEPVDVRTLLEEVCADASFEAASERGMVRLTATVAAVTPGSPGLLRSAIDNVVRNALAHSPQGREVEVSLGVEDADGGTRRVLITVRDHGPGVPPEDLERLFEPFYRVSEARDRSSGGIGLGLAITERAIRWHGGTVGASNHPAGGLVVMIRLPLAPESA